AGGLQHILGIVGGVINNHLRARWCAGECEGKARSADQDRTDEARLHGVVQREGVMMSCGVLGSPVRRSAAQSRPLRRSHAAAKPLRSCSTMTSAIAA